MEPELRGGMEEYNVYYILKVSLKAKLESLIIIALQKAMAVYILPSHHQCLQRILIFIIFLKAYFSLFFFKLVFVIKVKNTYLIQEDIQEKVSITYNLTTTQR